MIVGLLPAVNVWSCVRLRNERRTAAPPGRPAARAWGEAAALTLGFAAILVLVAAALHRDYEDFDFGYFARPSATLFGWFLNRSVGAIAQQVVLHLFLWPHCFQVVRTGVGALILATSLFGLLHLPSPTLVAMASCGCVAWVVLYRRNGRITPLILSHIILSALAYVSFPDRLIYHMKVGADALAERESLLSLSNPKSVELIGILASREYFAAQGETPRMLVDGLYREVLGRAPSAVEQAYWLGQLRRRSRAQVCGALLTCEEAVLIRRQRLNERTVFFLSRRELLRPSSRVASRAGGRIYLAEEPSLER